MNQIDAIIEDYNNNIKNIYERAKSLNRSDIKLDKEYNQIMINYDLDFEIIIQFMSYSEFPTDKYFNVVEMEFKDEQDLHNYVLSNFLEDKFGDDDWIKYYDQMYSQDLKEIDVEIISSKEKLEIKREIKRLFKETIEEIQSKYNDLFSIILQENLFSRIKFISEEYGNLIIKMKRQNPKIAKYKRIMKKLYEEEIYQSNLAKEKFFGKLNRFDLPP